MNSLQEKLVLGHPSGLFVLFFTEMWERFSYYGMRALMVLFLTTAIIGGENPGWGWERSDALGLYALYTGLVYFTPLIGGVIADKYTGYRKAVVMGAFTMALGHGLLAIETPLFFYLGLTALIIGNGLFKPNISSIVGQLYDDEDKKDAAYTIFYMGINAGAFLGILLCGYIGEKIGWSYGFGLAMIFMVAGALQFWFSGKIFGDIGLAPKKDGVADNDAPMDQQFADDNKSRITKWTIIGVVTTAVIGLLIHFFSPIKDVSSALSTTNTFMPALIFGSVTGIIGFLVTDPHLTKIQIDRIWVIVTFTFFVIFFWWAFEQAGGSMTIFARDYTDRTLEGGQATTFLTFNTLLTVVPLMVITWVLFKLFSVTFSKIALANTILGFSFVIIWGIVIWMLWREFQAETTEVQASWFSILNSFFIITFAPLFSKFWDMKIITSGPVKFALGLGLLAIGFAFLAWGSSSIPQGAKVASVSMIWLILAYLFHTLGELCLSPVGLAYVSKLAPVRLVGLMFGVWFIANFAANWAAGMTGSFIDQIVESTSMSGFFLIFTLIPAGAAVVMLLLKGTLTRKMHGVDHD